jgi:hypothetical protein
MSTAEIIVGDPNYGTQELTVKSDLYDISELKD